MIHVMIPNHGMHGDLSIQAAPKFCRLLYERKSPLIAVLTEDKGSLDFDKTVNCITGGLLRYPFSWVTRPDVA